jgi:hypothetical protein
MNKIEISDQAKPAVRRGRKAAGLFKDEKIAGLPEEIITGSRLFY